MLGDQPGQPALFGYLPPRELWPERLFALPQYRQPERLNVAEFLLDRNLSRGLADKTAIFCGSQQLTYLELAEKVNRLASSLVKLGIDRYDRVVLRFTNTPEFIISWLAIVKIGAICVSTMPLLRKRELGYIANDSEAKAVIVASGLVEELEKATDEFSTVERIIVAGPYSGDCISFQDLLEAGERDFAAASTGRDDPAIICYTSGSTGQPKGAVHFHEDLLNCTEAYGQHILAPTPDDVFSGHPTMAFTFGLGALLLFPLRWGATTVLLPSFSPEKVYGAIEGHRVTVLFGSPTSFRMMLAKRDRDYDLSSLRVCASAGEPLPASVFHQWKERFGVELLEHIGSTEMLYAFISNVSGQARPGSCGRVLPGYQARVVDKDFNEMPPGQVGQLAVKGPLGCLYWRKPDHQREYVRFGGWNFPGDLVTRDEEGYFYYQCRADDLIISGGYNIAAIEIEQALMESPVVVDAAVVGSPDPIRNQKVKAFVILKKGVSPSELLIEELQDSVKNTLAPYKYPREIEFVSYLPRTQTGKIRRVELREREMKKYQQQGAG